MNFWKNLKNWKEIQFDNFVDIEIGKKDNNAADNEIIGVGLEINNPIEKYILENHLRDMTTIFLVDKF